jgi:maltoporin
LFTHSLTASREHLLGDNADNLRLTQVRYSVSSPVFRYMDVGATVSLNFAEESGVGFREGFTYYRAGVRIGYQFHKYWRTGLEYDFSLKESNLPLRDYYRNQVTWELAFSY